MATFDEFYASLDSDVGVRGKQFEKFVKWFLKTDPTWASQIDEVWLWNDYPKRWGADCGIDLVFTSKNGKTWAVQSKCVSPNNDIRKSEIDSFLSESSDSKIDGRLLIASTDGIGKNAQQVINRQEKQVVCFLLEQFRQSQIEFPSSIEDLNQGKRKEKKKPRPHQIEAIKKVSEGIKNADRGQVLMACGTGKTLTSLWIKEKIKAEQVLVLVPSLSLLSQTLKEWNAEANDPFKWICVCSDKSVAKNKSEDEWISNTSAIGVPVTSDPLEIKHFIDESGSKVVFATYQSAQLIVEAQEHHDTSYFDLVIADEAHRCAGKVSDTFGSVLDENKIKSSKRLFFTATPKILSKQIRTKSHDMDFEVASMDDHFVFGAVLYEIKFSEAIKRDLLSDYQVVVIGVDDEMIKQKIVNRELIKINDETILDAETIASQIAITKAIKDYDLKRVITFHSRINNAKEFAHTFDQVISQILKSDLPSGKISCEHISGIMKTSERNQKLNEIKNLELNEKRILTNARCLSEGVDVPTLSGIAFINPKQSQIDIIQAVGRAIRKSDDKSKGTIVIPLYISEKESLDDAILLSNFKKVWQIVIALKSQDDALMECIDTLRIQKGKENKITHERSELDKFIFDIPERISKRFPRSIKTLLVEKSSEDWFERFGEIKELKLKNGPSANPPIKSPLYYWCIRQRREYLNKNKKLSKEKVNLLNTIEGWEWEVWDEKWTKKYEELKEFKLKNGSHISPKNGSSLSYWCTKQRQKYREGLLSKEYINLLEDLNFIWDTYNDQWHNQFQELKEFKLKNGSLTLPETDSKLAYWCVRQRISYKKGDLSEERQNLLESIGFNLELREVSEKVIWESRYEELKKYKFKHGHTETGKSDSDLHKWCLVQRVAHNQRKLSEERQNLLESIGFIWDVPEYEWQLKFQELKKFKSENENLITSKSDHLLHRWCISQRITYKKGKLSEERQNLLESIGFIWDIPEYEWQLKFQELKKFNLENGHCNPSSRHQNLGKYVGYQRDSYKKGKLSPDKIQLLESIGFIWDVPEYEWQLKFQELKKFNLENGHCNPSVRNHELGNFVLWQRQLYIKGKISQERIDLLESIGFKWRLKD